MSTPFHLRPYRADDEEAAIALWLATWQRAYPSIDFAARVPWWRERWRDELVPNAAIMVAEQAGLLIGFVTLDATGYLDQLVVAPEQWGSELGNRPDIRIVGDRFVFQSEVFFDTGQAQLLPEGRAELDKLATALIDLDKQIPPDRKSTRLNSSHRR